MGDIMHMAMVTVMVKYSKYGLKSLSSKFKASTLNEGVRKLHDGWWVVLVVFNRPERQALGIQILLTHSLSHAVTQSRRHSVTEDILSFEASIMKLSK